MLCDSARPFLLSQCILAVGSGLVGKSCFSLSLPSLGNCVSISFIVNHVLCHFCFRFFYLALPHRLSFGLTVGCPTSWSRLYIFPVSFPPFDTFSFIFIFFLPWPVCSTRPISHILFSIASSRVLRCRAIRSRIFSLFYICLSFYLSMLLSMVAFLLAVFPCILSLQGWSSYRCMLDSSVSSYSTIHAFHLVLCRAISPPCLALALCCPLSSLIV